MSRYHDTIVASGLKVGKQLPHWKRCRIYFEESLDVMLEQERQNWWQQLDDDAVAGNLPEWTDE